MKNMHNAQEYTPPPPVGKYVIWFTSAEPELSKPDEQRKKEGGVPMIKCSAEVAGDANGTDQYNGAKVWPFYWITDGDAKGAGITKANLRALGYPVDDPAFEKDDAEIARELVNLKVWANLKHEPIMGKNDVTGKFDRPREVMHGGKIVKAMRLVLDSVIGPVEAPGAVPTQQAAPATPAAPQAPAGAPAAQPAAPATTAKPWLKTKPAAPAAK